MLTAGGVLSRLMMTLSLALFPARSTAMPVTSWSAPSVISAIGSGRMSSPERLSLATKLTVTSVLFQPAALGSGPTTAVMTGGVLSRRMVPVTGKEVASISL